MASTFSPFHSQIVSPAAARKSPPTPQRSNWWAPVFGWSLEPDYVNDNGTRSSNNVQIEADLGFRNGKKQYRGCLTEEKAKELRRKTVENSNFHDVMYHSAIASRLASDVSGRR